MRKMVAASIAAVVEGELQRMAFVLALGLGVVGGCTPPPERQFPTGGPVHRGPPPTLVAEVRDYVVEPAANLESVTVAARPFGATGWEIVVDNKSPEALSIVWDESTFADSKGFSQGRLIRGETRRMDVAKGQPTTPVPAGTKVLERVFVEKLLALEEFEAKNVGRQMAREDHDRYLQLRKEARAAIVGGKLLVVVTSAAGKQTWTGNVVDAAGASSGQAPQAP